MAKDSKIEWTHHTFNPWWGCVRVSPACEHCYAEAWAKRVGQDVWGKRAARRAFGDAHWREPLKWNREAVGAGERQRVFCASMADVFEDRRDLDRHRERLWRLIDETPALDWLLLTKRPEAVAGVVPWGKSWPKNVWLGTTVEDQKRADQRLPHLLAVPAIVHFLSCEPLLGPIDLRGRLGGSGVRSGASRKVDWVIAGGESGGHARAMSLKWVRDLRDQCRDAGVPFHFKQWGNWRPAERGEVFGRRGVVALEDGTLVVREPKNKTGRLLDGRTWDAFPPTDAGRPLATRDATGVARRRLAVLT